MTENKAATLLMFYVEMRSQTENMSYQLQDSRQREGSSASLLTIT